MSTILDEIAEYTKARIALEKEQVSPDMMREMALKKEWEKEAFAFEKTLKTPGISFICECKKASPSKGSISADFPYLDIARSYEDAGAAAISVQIGRAHV